MKKVKKIGNMNIEDNKKMHTKTPGTYKVRF